jgi:hypothetical protein
MATVRSVRIDLGIAVPLPFLPIDDLDTVPDIDPSYVCRAVAGMCRGDYAEHYCKFSQLCHGVWERVRTLFLDTDISLHLATVPSQMQEKHLAHLAVYMGVCIRILCFDTMGREIAKYGDPRGTQHLYIYRQDCHYYPIYKVHCLPASADGRPTPSNWCDFCSKLVGTKLQDGCAHIQKCAVRATEDAATTLERLFLSKWHAKHQATFRYSGRGKPRP